MSEQETPEGADAKTPELSEEAMEALQQQRFQERVRRVLEVMHKERIDWQGRPTITPDGRITVQLVPVEIPREPRRDIAQKPQG